MKKQHTPDKRHLIKWVEKFKQVPILVVGDLMLDKSVRGTVERISPEAPVPVIDIKEEFSAPGGAGNVVLNLVALGASPTLLSVRGDDDAGELLEFEFRSKNVDLSGIIVDHSRPTTTKTRVIAGHQQVARLDHERRGQFSADITRELLARLRHLIPKYKVVLISDYGKGVVSPAVIKTAIQLARKTGASVIVDPKIEHFFQYKGVDCLTPNTKEAIEGMRAPAPKDEVAFEKLGWSILKKLKSNSLLITRGEKGMALFEKNGSLTQIATRAREVFDVTGAGDTVVSTFSLARAVNAPYQIAAEISNYAASIVVAKLGTATASQAELIRLLNNL